MAPGMAPVSGDREASSRPLSALPSVQARALAFAAIIVGGLCGGLIGFSTVKIGCRGSCSTPEGVGGLSGAILGAVGVAVIAVLVLRAMGEWRTIQEKRQMEMVIGAATAFSRSSDADASTAEPALETPLETSPTPRLGPEPTERPAATDAEPDPPLSPPPISPPEP